MKKITRIANGRIIDPANNRDERGDLWIAEGKISAPLPGQETETIDASSHVVAPGLIDIHVHLREPGQSHKETIATATRAAAAGGFTSIVAMPNTSPTADSAGTIAWIKEKASREACANVFCTGAITKGLRGEELAPIGSLFQAGVVALTDDGHCIQNHEIMRRAVEYARMFGLPVMDHCQDESLVGDGIMHEGEWSLRLGLPGWPRAGEEMIVARNILLAELCDAPIHCQHISSGGSVRLLREARARGVKISGEVCPHHIALTDASLEAFDSDFKMNPPLRTPEDIEAIIAGLADGTLTILCSDHAPHASYEKEVEIDRAPFGITGLETEFAIFHHILVHKRRAISLPRLIALLTSEPAALLKLDRGTLGEGVPADVTLIAPDLEWTFDKTQSLSLSRNTPFHGHLDWPRRAHDSCRRNDLVARRLPQPRALAFSCLSKKAPARFRGRFRPARPPAPRRCSGSSRNSPPDHGECSEQIPPALFPAPSAWAPPRNPPSPSAVKQLTPSCWIAWVLAQTRSSP